MMKRIFYSAPIFAVPFWFGLIGLAPFLAARIVIGRWNVNGLHTSDMPVAALITFAIWGLIVYLYGHVRKHYESGGQ